MGKEITVSTRFEALAEEFNEHDKQAGQSFVAMLNTQMKAKREYQERTRKVHGFNEAWADRTGKTISTIKQYNWLAKKVDLGVGWYSVSGMSCEQLIQLFKQSENKPSSSDSTEYNLLGGKEYLYLITNPGFDGWVKVGESDDVAGRVKNFQTASPYEYTVEEVYKMPFGFSDTTIHPWLSARFNSSREWFECSVDEARAIVEPMLKHWDDMEGISFLPPEVSHKQLTRRKHDRSNRLSTPNTPVPVQPLA